MLSLMQRVHHFDITGRMAPTGSTEGSTPKIHLKPEHIWGNHKSAKTVSPLGFTTFYRFHFETNLFMNYSFNRPQPSKLFTHTFDTEIGGPTGSGSFTYANHPTPDSVEWKESVERDSAWTLFL